MMTVFIRFVLFFYFHTINRCFDDPIKSGEDEKNGQRYGIEDN